MEIVLIRHGKPEAANNNVLSASGFTKWIRKYNHSKVCNSSRPASINEGYKDHYAISSDLKRAIHSTELYTGSLPETQYSVLREMEIPRYKLPFRLRAWTWVYLNRFLWMLGRRGPFESYKQAKQRAKLATEKLINLALQENKIIVFGHGYMNIHIRKYLRQAGWKIKMKSNEYWGVSVLTAEPSIE